MTTTITQPTTSRVGRRVEQARYRIPAGERALYAQRVNGRVALVDVPVDHSDHVLLVERHVESHAELQGIVAAYVEHSAHAGRPALLASRASSTTSQTAADSAHPQPPRTLARLASRQGR